MLQSIQSWAKIKTTLINMKHVNMKISDEINYDREAPRQLLSTSSTYLCVCGRVSEGLQMFWTLSHSSDDGICMVSLLYGPWYETWARNLWQMLSRTGCIHIWTGGRLYEIFHVPTNRIEAWQNKHTTAYSSVFTLPKNIKTLWVQMQFVLHDT